MNGILLVDKPVGFTSHDVVARVRRLLKEKRVGHTGTLDPFATGLLVVLVGRATRLAQFFNISQKEYDAVIRFGYATETGDATGAIRTDSRANTPSTEFSALWDDTTIENALATLRGTIQQVPPMYSAKKIKGKRLYELARRGEEVERSAVGVTIYEFETRPPVGAMLAHNPDGTCDLAVRVVCSAGTYVRTLAENVGECLGVASHLSVLRRTCAGDFQIRDATSLAALEELVNSHGDLASVMVRSSVALSKMRSMSLEDDVIRRVRHGASVRIAEILADGENVQMTDQTGELIAIGVYDKHETSLHPRIVFATED
jgi:tRNA pseudouridine55 synthase